MTDYTPHATSPITCWRCGAQLVGHVNADADETTGPAPDSVTICFPCGTPGIFTSTPGGLALREPTGTEWLELAADSGFIWALATYLKMREMEDEGGA